MAEVICIENEGVVPFRFGKGGGVFDVDIFRTAAALKELVDQTEGDETRYMAETLAYIHMLGGPPADRLSFADALSFTRAVSDQCLAVKKKLGLSEEPPDGPPSSASTPSPASTAPTP